MTMANAEWTTIDPAELSAFTQQKYNAMKQAYRYYAEAKAEFEARMQQDFAEHLPHGQELKFGYKFGKLSVAVGELRERTQAKAKESFTNWLAQRQSNGQRI
jgi:hypothetical protein